MGVACYQESVIRIYERLKDGKTFIGASDTVFMVVDAGGAGWSCPECVGCLYSTRELRVASFQNVRAYVRIAQACYNRFEGIGHGFGGVWVYNQDFVVGHGSNDTK